ncbi:CPBP family intramembrane metalloprotease [Calidifontibacter sp. DB0510]|uniref:CPBP family intramembrane metalloprotease n=2 Tax=Metallococcus carri TaxID=1656884 RepID=A0A967B0W6_9MICO|nr:CPBP family intramembrane metalloprotease [Metallococcus carri]NOP38690.1 CPBP family intramembrane metalloprotease [Calidifontibacter sp. DB2511S]
MLRGPMPVPRTRLSRRTLLQETALVLAVGLGASAVYSILAILRMLSTHVALNKQTSTLNPSQAQAGWLDLLYQLVGIGFGVVPALLAIHLLARELRSATSYLGFDLTKPGPDLALGTILTAVVGIPGLLLYAAARALGLNTTVAASGLGDHWWSIPVLILAAAQNAVLEEVVMLGYLFTRWTQARWRLPIVLITSAVIRGSYHLYQGFGGFVGNVLMGLLFGLVYLRVRRVMPFVIAHTLLDVVAFVGYVLLRSHVSWL